MKHQAIYNPESPECWDIEGFGTVSVGDSYFDDHERVLAWWYVDEITLEPITGDPMETTLEPVFWVSDGNSESKELSESEMRAYL